MTDQPIKCCLCGAMIPSYRLSHNPAPLGEPRDRCCGDCNNAKVIPARIMQLQRNESHTK